MPYDLRIGLPFPDESLDFIYAEHVLEHFDYRDLFHLLQHCLRVLRLGGTMSIVVPDAELYLKAYFHPETF